MTKFISVAIITILTSISGSYAVDTMPVQGRDLFMVNCSMCHGENGDNKGPVCFSRNVEKNGKILQTYARDFTAGVFKFRTTSTGCLPGDNDLLQTINNGIPKSLMPSFADLSKKEKDALVEYVKSFSSRWEEEPACNAIAVEPPMWVGTPDSIKKGEIIYKKVKCWECHGDTGRGDGNKSEDLKDDWGHKIRPFDFTTGELKRGTSPAAIYITFTTGLDGSGMPSYEDSIKEEDRWHLVSFTLKLMGM